MSIPARENFVRNIIFQILNQYSFLPHPTTSSLIIIKRENVCIYHKVNHINCGYYLPTHAFYSI